MGGIYHWLSFIFISFLLLAVSYSVVLAQSNNSGININGSGGLDYNSDKPWADAMRSHRSWYKIGSDISDNARKDANYWPTEDAQCLVWAGAQNNQGTYKLSFTGQATIAASGGTIQNKSYNSSTNTTTADLVITDANNDFLSLAFTNTKRTAAGATNTGVLNVKLMRPVAPGSSQSYTTDKIFTDQFMTAIKKFTTIRFMDWTATNSSEEIDWANRTLWTFARQNPPDLPHFRYSPDIRWQGRPASWESVIMMCNEANRDAWICVPHMATDDYITNLANLFKNGNEHTPGLKSTLKLYVEYSNELWNGGLAFQQTPTVKEMAQTYGHPLGFDGEDNADILFYRFKAMRAVQISNIFRSIFGNAAMMTRIRPMLPWHQDVQYFTTHTLSFIDRYFNKRDSRSDWGDPHPLNYYIWGGGGSTYYSARIEHDDESVEIPGSIDEFWDFGPMNPQNFYDLIKHDAIYASAFGLNYSAYEGNADPGNMGDESVQLQIQNDPKMKQEIKEHHNVFSQLGGNLFCYFNLSGVGLGFEPFDLQNLTSPRFNAVSELSGETRKAVNYGPIPPFSRPGNSFDIRYDDKSRLLETGGTDLYADDYFYSASYAFHVTNDGPYTVQIQYATSGTAKLIVENNGAVVSTLNLPNTNDATRSSSQMTITCSKSKLQTIRLICTQGAVTIKKVNVSGTGNPVDDVSSDVVYDNCNSITGWQGSASITADTGNRLEGTASISVTKQSPGISKALSTPLNVSNKNRLKLWIYISDVSKFSSGGQIEMTSSGSFDVNEYYWDINASMGLVNGWNHVTLKFADAKVTGNAPDLRAINFFRFYKFTSASVTLRLDDIRFSTNDDVPMDFGETTTDWKSGATLSRDTGTKKEGTSSLKSVGSHQDRFAKTFVTPIPTKVDTSGYLKFWIYVSDVTKFNGGGQVEISSSGRPDVNEYNWSVSSLNLQNGWNYVQLKLAKGHPTGGTPNFNAINFFRLYQFMASGSEVTTRIDDIRFSKTPPASAASAREVTPDVAVNELDETRVMKGTTTIYPVPVKDKVTVSSAADQSPISHISILNLQGTRVFSTPTATGATSHEIIVEELSKGIFLMHVVHENGQVEIIRFIKD